MKHKKLIISTLLLSLLLASCASGGDDHGDVTSTPDSADTDGSSTAETLPPEKTLDLPDTDFGGREFRVLSYGNSKYTQFQNFEISSDGENGDVVNDAVFRRNRSIEEKYNVRIKEYRDDTNEDFLTSTLPLLRKTVMANEDLYDLAFMTLYSIGTAAREDLLRDLNSVDHIDFSKDWWNPNVNETLEINRKLYFTSSDFSLRDKNRTYILVFNKRIVEDNSLGDLFAVVRDGKWTLDVMGEWAAAVSKDLNGNGEVDYTDAFGIGTDSGNAFVAMVYSCGVNALKNDSGGRPQLNLNNEHTVNAIDKVMALYSQPEISINCEDYRGKDTGSLDYNSVASGAFYEGRLLFNASFPHSLKNYSAKCVDDYGVIPFPKYDDRQTSYMTYADNFGMLFCVPASCGDPDFTGFMLEALSAASTDTSLKAYYEVSCKTKYTYDPDSAEMLDLAFSNIVYDTSRIYSINGVHDLLHTMAGKKKNNLASSYATIEKKASADLDKLWEDFGE